MSKYIAFIPMEKIERIQIYVNKSAKTLAEIKAETGADYLINGGPGGMPPPGGRADLC